MFCGYADRSHCRRIRLRGCLTFRRLPIRRIVFPYFFSVLPTKTTNLFSHQYFFLFLWRASRPIKIKMPVASLKRALLRAKHNQCESVDDYGLRGDIFQNFGHLDFLLAWRVATVADLQKTIVKSFSFDSCLNA